MIFSQKCNEIGPTLGRPMSHGGYLFRVSTRNRSRESRTLPICTRLCGLISRFLTPHFQNIWRSRKTLRIHGLDMGSLAYGRTRYSSDGILKLPIWTSRWAARSQHSELQGDNVCLAPSCQDPGNFRALFFFFFFLFFLNFFFFFWRKNLTPPKVVRLTGNPN